VGVLAGLPRGWPDQKAIYYILGDDPTSVGRSPHLDYFKAHDVEVLYLTETIDSFMVLGLREFEGKPVQNVDDAGLELATEAPATDQLPADRFDALVERFRRVLGERITGVRESRLLTDSPCRLVSPEGAAERDMARVRRLLDQSFEAPKKLLEINRGHALLRELSRLVRPARRAVIDLDRATVRKRCWSRDSPQSANMVGRIQTLMKQP
jgi:molecular chaperone HtpG